MCKDVAFEDLVNSLFEQDADCKDVMQRPKAKSILKKTGLNEMPYILNHC